MSRIKIYLLITSCLLLCSLSKVNALSNNSRLYDEAKSLARNGKYKEASLIYKKIIDKEDSLSLDISSKQVKNLRTTYSLKQIELQNNKRKGILLKYVLFSIVSLLLISMALSIYWNKKKKELIVVNQQLAKSKKLTEISIKNKSILFSNMSHEIKTPLNALAGFSDILSNENIDVDTRKQCRDIIKLNSELLMNLLNDVVDLSCIDIKNIKLSIEQNDIVKICDRTILTIKKIKQTQASITFNTDLKELPINTDKLRLQQVLINLLINATKFTKEGEIILSLKINKDQMAEFSVSDTGCGIPLDKQKDLFSRFERVDEHIQGTGLGLYISKLIVEKLGGKIWIDSTYTKGTRFVFTHPLINEELT